MSFNAFHPVEIDIAPVRRTVRAEPRAEKKVKEKGSLLFTVGVIAILAWGVFEIGVGFWIGAHHGVLTALASLAAFHLVTLVVFLGFTHTYTSPTPVPPAALTR